jgi:hypothetical protein
MFSYIGIISSILLVVVATGFVPSSTTGANCDEAYSSSWHWILVSSVDTFQAVTILVLTLLFCKRSQQPKEQTSRPEQIKVMADDDVILKRLIGQSTMLAVFYALWAIAQWSILVVAHEQLMNHDLLCIN